MTTLLASRPHFPMDPSPFNAHALPPTAGSSSHSSPRTFAAEASSAAAPDSRPSLYGSPFMPRENSARPRTQSPLQISTTAASAHEQEPEEETAHPSRMRSQLQHGKAGDDAAKGAEASSSSSTARRTPSPPRALPTARPSSSSLTASHGFGNLDEGLSRPLTHKERELLAHLDRLKFFLATAPSRWTDAADVNPTDPSALPVGHPNSAHPALNRFLLPNSEYVSCVLWGGLYHITGTDIVRALVFRFEAFGRPVKNMKKFEEGVFSDLRNLKPGVDACLEEPKSPFLDLLFKYQCIRTQKKQKVFYWFSVPHDRLFLDALERDLKREKMGLEPTTVITGEPALSFTYDPKRSLYEQFSKASGAAEGEGELEAAVRRVDESKSGDEEDKGNGASSSSEKQQSDADMSSSEADEGRSSDEKKPAKAKSALHGPNSPFFSMFSLFEGSPTYKQRRKKVPKHRSPSLLGVSPYMTDPADDYFGITPGMGNMRALEPQMDRYGRDTTRLSAAEMFLAQARGDFGPQSNPDLIASQKERQRRAMLARAGQLADKGYFGAGLPGADAGMHQQGLRASPESMFPGHSPAMMASGSLPMDQDMGRPHMEQRHTFPLSTFPVQDRPRTHTQPFGSDVSTPWQQPSEPIPIQRTKAFVCPLFSCGRMFKRMEHLKRHLRTHTLERPYQCQRCKKRFSRSDNLNQHLRTHTRADGAEGDGEADVESEDVDEIDGDEASIENYINALGHMPDVQMCEVEIQGQVQEVQGDEDGLVVPAPSLTHSSSSSASVDEAQELYYGDASSGVLVDASSEPSAFVTNSPGGGQWATIRSSHPSPAFSTVSMPSPSLSSSYGSSYSVTDYISMSAPSHKQTFDHSSLYPPVADLNGPGPIRRHRSATPSVSRYSENGRRPYTASEGSRSFHPYAMPAHSADNSPMAYTVPLAYDGSPQMGALARPPAHHSRSSSAGGLQEQLDQMLSLEPLDGAGLPGSYHEPAPMPPVQGAYGDLYRTDSPMQFAGTPAGPYDVDVDAQTQGVFPMSLDSQVDVSPFPLAQGGFYNGLASHGSVTL